MCYSISFGCCAAALGVVKFFSNIFGILLVLRLAMVWAIAEQVITETFDTAPLGRGWSVHGDSTLFQWNLTNQNMEITWDSRRPNSYFYLPLNTLLTKTDDFLFRLDLRMDLITPGISSNRPFTFQMAFGLINLLQATHTNFFRGSGIHPVYGPKDLIEFNYFPDTGFGATFAPTVVSSNNRIIFSDNHPLEMTTGDWFQITLDYRASNQVLRTSVLRNGAPYGMTPNNSISDLSLAGFPDFRVGAFSIHSYNDEHQPPPGGSLLARGVVDQIYLVIPDPPVSNLRGRKSGEFIDLTFMSRSNWIYQVEKSENLLNWNDAGLTIQGNGTETNWLDRIEALPKQFYRIRAERP